MMLLLVAALSSACRERSYQAFYATERQYQSLVARNGDDAFTMEEMDGVVSELKSVPERAPERAKAVTLLATIDATRARLKEEAATNEGTSPPAVAPPSDVGALEPVAETPPPTAADPALEAGLAEEKFLESYAACVGTAERVDDPVLGAPGVGYPIRDTPQCLKRLSSVKDTRFVFITKAFAGRLVVTKPVAVEKPVGPAPTPIETQKRREFLLVPGAPLPPEFAGNQPPPSPGTVPMATTGDGLPQAPVEGLQPRVP
jgi:hypothetical protein